MTEQQLLYFSTIVSTGSYGETAMELDISQSAVSKQIQALEDELGVKLFDRTRRKIRLTPAGERLCPDLMNLLGDIFKIKKDAEKLHPNYPKHISILTIPISGQFHFHTSVCRFEKEYPDYSAELVELEEPSLFRRIAHNDYQIAIAYYDESYLTSQNTFTPIIHDEIVLAVPADHPLASHDYIIPEDLHMLPIMGMDSFTCIHHIYQQYFDQRGIRLNILFQGRPESILGGVEAGKCPALVTRLQANHFNIRNVKLISFSPSIPAELGFITCKKEQKDPEFRTLVRFFKELY